MRGRKVLGGLSVILGAMALMSSQAFAQTTYTPVAGTSSSFNKNLIMDAGDTVPNATFSFTVAPGEAKSLDTSDNRVMMVMAGVGTPTVSDVTFAPSDSTATEAGTNIDVARTQEDRTGTAGTDTVQLDAGEKFATHQATIDFSRVNFDEPGIYRYIITETANADHAAAGIIHDSDVDRVLDVYVTDNGSGVLQVAQYVMHTSADDVVINANMGAGDVAKDGDPLDDKTDGFTNEYTSKDLRFSKEVSGSGASRDKYFEFTVTCSNIADEDSYVVSLADDSDANTNDGNADNTSGAVKIGGTVAANAGKTNPTTVTGAQLKDGQKFYLQHGQNIVIRGLALNANYTVTENAEDYKSDILSGKTNSGVIGTVAGENKVAEAGFMNSITNIVPTNVIVKIGIGLAVLALGLVILAIFRFINKKAKIMA